MAVDAFKGMNLSKEWGVSKISGMMGGLLAGTDKGLKGALKGMGKWALIGAGIGSVVPIVGTIIGGLLGAAVGGILGWIGGENVAKVFDTMGAWIKEKITAVSVWWEKSAKPVIASLTKWAIEDLWPVLKEFGGWVKTKAGNIIGYLNTSVKFIWDKISVIIEDVGLILKDWWPSIEKFGKNIGETFTTTISLAGPALDKFFDTFVGGIDNMIEFLTDIPKMLKNLITKAKEQLTNTLKKIPWLREVIENKELGENQAVSKTERLKQDIKAAKTQEEIEKLKTIYLEQLKSIVESGGINKERASELRSAVGQERREALSLLNLPKAALGGYVEKTGAAIIHKGENIIPDNKPVSFKEGKSIDLHVQELKTTMEQVKNGISDLVDISKQSFKLSTNTVKTKLPNSPIPNNIDGGRETAYDAAYKLRYSAWEIIHGVA